MTEKPLNHYSPSYLSSGKDSYAHDRFSLLLVFGLTVRNQFPGLYNNEDISYPNIQRPAYPFYLSPLNKIVDENEDNRSFYPLYSVILGFSLLSRTLQVVAYAADIASTIPPTNISIIYLLTLPLWVSIHLKNFTTLSLFLTPLPPFSLWDRTLLCSINCTIPLLLPTKPTELRTFLVRLSHPQSSVRYGTKAIFAETPRAAPLDRGLREWRRKNQSWCPQYVDAGSQRRPCSGSSAQWRAHYRVSIERRRRSRLRSGRGAVCRPCSAVPVCSNCSTDAVRPLSAKRSRETTTQPSAGRRASTRRFGRQHGRRRVVPRDRKWWRAADSDAAICRTATHHVDAIAASKGLGEPSRSRRSHWPRWIELQRQHEFAIGVSIDFPVDFAVDLAVETFFGGRRAQCVEDCEARYASKSDVT